MDSLSIILLGVTLFLVEVQIIRLQNQNHKLMRMCKSLSRGMTIQGFINESFCDTMGDILSRVEESENNK